MLYFKVTIIVLIYGLLEYSFTKWPKVNHPSEIQKKLSRKDNQYNYNTGGARGYIWIFMKGYQQSEVYKSHFNKLSKNNNWVLCHETNSKIRILKVWLQRNTVTSSNMIQCVLRFLISGIIHGSSNLIGKRFALKNWKLLGYRTLVMKWIQDISKNHAIDLKRKIKWHK